MVKIKIGTYSHQWDCPNWDAQLLCLNWSATVDQANEFSSFHPVDFVGNIVCIVDSHDLEVSRFQKWGYSQFSNINGIFYEIKHPAIGYPHLQEKQLEHTFMLNWTSPGKSMTQVGHVSHRWGFNFVVVNSHWCGLVSQTSCCSRNRKERLRKVQKVPKDVNSMMMTIIDTLW